MSDPRIPLTVVGGYLGAGKTTLLNHVLQHGHGRRFAVLVNDFGSLDIDADLIQGRDETVVRLANGCVCCNLVGGLEAALGRLRDLDPRPDHVLVEASGVADPARIAWHSHIAPFTPGGVLVLVDAETVRDKSTDRFVGDSVLRQLRSADLLVLNKLDLVTPEQREEVRAWLASVVPGASLLATSHGRVPTEVLLLPGSPEAEVFLADHPGEYASWSFESPAPLREPLFRESVAAWPPSVLRAKGFVHLAEDPGRRHLFQWTGRRWTLLPDRPWEADPPRTGLVLIGVAGQVDGGALLAGLDAARADRS